jgi:2-amino-4-hydroxy-6-hydroxymethyldihydropteridine diphosphokinase
MPRTLAAIALGSNLGDRASHLEYAKRRLASVLHDLRASAAIETEPEGVAPQPRFLNAAVVGQTDLTARLLLEFLLQVERERGRERPFPGAPRPLDLDLILYGDAVIDEPGLRVPHPRFRDRTFVLGPLEEIAPGVVDPVTGRTVAELLADLGEGS